VSRLRPLLWPTIGLVAYVALAAATPLWREGLALLFPGESRLLYTGATPLALVGQHVELVAISSIISIAVGLGLGVFVTRPAGADYFDVVADLTTLGQTFPPVAVFTLAVPLLGFGLRPTVLALALYGVLPVLQNTVAGLKGMQPDIMESASGIGLSPVQRLWRVELPLAAPIILTGVRVSVIVNVATGTIGAIAGAGGFGAPIINGLVNNVEGQFQVNVPNPAGLALALDAMLAGAERSIASRRA
jgi:osmoprotectant transport system permease protein